MLVITSGDQSFKYQIEWPMSHYTGKWHFTLVNFYDNLAIVRKQFTSGSSWLAYRSHSITQQSSWLAYFSSGSSSLAYFSCIFMSYNLTRKHTTFQHSRNSNLQTRRGYKKSRSMSIQHMQIFSNRGCHAANTNGNSIQFYKDVPKLILSSSHFSFVLFKQDRRHKLMITSTEM